MLLFCVNMSKGISLVNMYVCMYVCIYIFIYIVYSQHAPLPSVILHALPDHLHSFVSFIQNLHSSLNTTDLVSQPYKMRHNM